jgi:transcriptional regulator GlxA family with amidase domain
VIAPRRLIFFVTNDLQALDLFGPLEAFAAANELARASYEWQVAGLATGRVTSESGVRIVIDQSIDAEEDFDTLVLCGGRGARTAQLSKKQREALSRAAARAGRVVSICTGAFLLAETGIADGRRVATHWRHAHELQDRFPGLQVDADALFVREGNLWSSAGVTAGIDLALAIIAEDCGSVAATAVARQLVVYVRRAGDQAQFSEPLQVQARNDHRLASLVEWVTNHISEPLQVDALAERMAMGTRHFSRTFRAAFGTSPARFVEQVRLDRARAMLGSHGARIDQVAKATGFGSADTFRRAFQRRFCLAPSEYQERFEVPRRTRFR